MIFNSFVFLVVFPFIFLLYYAIPSKYLHGRNFFLLIVSYLLYINWKPIYALILLGITFISYFFALKIEKETGSRRKSLLIGGVSLSLMPLVLFKYYDFINEQVLSLLSLIGLRYDLQGLNWAIPIGISFFTFQAIGYMMDVYKERVIAERDFLSFALFVSFFPSIVAGPINKASLLIPQLKAHRPYFDYFKAVKGMKFILWGMFMKVVLADRVALYVDTVLPNYINYTGASCCLASVLYTIQIYADFAGYSLMAIGVGKTLGFELTENFRRPYFAVSVTDFWHRWHISLSTWLKDYVYIPLGGSRCTKIRNYWNILVTFLVSGIWHGANWTFVVWGMIHGIIQVLEKALGQQNCNYGIFGRTIKIVITFCLINFAWVFFRMPSIFDSICLFVKIFDFNSYSSLELPPKADILFITFSLCMVFIKDFCDEFCPSRLSLFDNKNVIVRYVAYLSIIVIILMTGVLGADQFIYANF